MHLKFGTNLYNFTRSGQLDGILAFVHKAEELGYHHLRLLDHVVGIVPSQQHNYSLVYSSESYMHECLTFMAYLAAVTRRIRLVTGVLVLAQRQTVLVAKQAAEVDILTGGRLTLGVGAGYNSIEFEAMGATFPDRGRRFEEQVEVLRALWTQDVVNYTGQWHRIRDASLAPRPVQRPIPLFLGSGRGPAPMPADKILRRIGRLADGWFPLFKVDDAAAEAIAKVHAAAREAGREPEDITIEMNLKVEGKSRQQLMDEINRMRDLGASQVNVGFGDHSEQGQLDALTRFREVMDAFD